MSEGSSKHVDQPDATTGLPVNPSSKTSLLERLKPVWWLRGVLAAVALVSLVDQLQIPRPDWLRFIHAIGARWNVWMGWLTDHLSAVLPFGMHLTAYEATFITLYSTIVIPGWVSQMRVSAPIVFAREIPPRPSPFRAGWLLRVIGEGALRGYIILVPILLVFYFGWLLGPNPEGDTRAVTMSNLLVFAATSLTYLFSLWDYNRRYLKALVISLSFIFTLELFYVVPIFREWLQPIAASIDPNPLHEQPSPFAAPQ